jgi:hypothetical protein
MVKKIFDEDARMAPGKPGTRADHPYAATDPIPVPDAVESDTDTTWALWEDLTTEKSGKKGEGGTAFAPTVLDTLPLSLTPETPKRGR